MFSPLHHLDFVIVIPTVNGHIKYVNTELTLLERIDDVPSNDVLNVNRRSYDSN